MRYRPGATIAARAGKAVCHLRLQSLSQADRKARRGIGTVSGELGQGVGRHALTLVLDDAFGVRGVPPWVDLRNFACGVPHEGEHRAAAFIGDARGTSGTWASLHGSAKRGGTRGRSVDICL